MAPLMGVIESCEESWDIDRLLWLDISALH